LRPGGDGWAFDHEPGSRTPSELAAEIVRAKPAYNAGALLRPIVQDLALPTAAYVGGHGELAYHVQLGELRERVGLAPGVFVPRLFATLTDAQVRKSLRHVQRGAAEFLRAPNLNTQADPTTAPGQAERLEAIFRTFRDQMLAEQQALKAIDPGLPSQLRRTLGTSKKGFEVLGKRIRRIESSSSGSDRRHQRRLSAQLWPRELPQERILTTCQMVSKWGRSWLDELFAVLEPLPLEHWIVHVDPHA
jgi:uncharacterized protein YllA (UPF0747 family)